ncbi:band 4.1-like protein 4 isoform X4 [Hypanus sabinus]|uniref:band 4.1-like protein 4 isoform X4 n=1 Tax=Hypanus sabinus TaxID=79690 RepID=UPI0028C3BEE7|nr:band 4.1-like protein 4 isoform X4 [Hypanus sabinus]
MGCFCTTQEEFYCEVLLLDETKLTLTAQQQGIKGMFSDVTWIRESGMQKSTKGSVVLDYVFRHVNLMETEYFGLRYCDRSHQTYWLDPMKTLAEHKDLINTGPPYTLYFGVKFYAEDPCKLKEEITRYQFFLQVKQDVLQGRLPCPLNIAAQLGAYALQSELGDYDPFKHTANYVSEYRFVPDQKEDLEEAIEQFHKALMGQVPAEAELNYLQVAKLLEMYGVDLHPVFGENQTEYFLGLTPVGVVVYKNKIQVGKYFWPRITKVNFRETQFELRVLGKDCSETSYFFEVPNKAACKHLWKCCVEYHTFFRLPETDEYSNSLSRKLSKLGSLGYRHRYSGRTAFQLNRDQSIELPRPDQNVQRTRSKTYPKRILHSPQSGSNSVSRSVTKTDSTKYDGPTKIIAPSPVKSSRATKLDGSPAIQNRTSAPWEENGPQRKSQNNGEDIDPKQHRRRSRSRGNTSGSGSESEHSSRERKRRNRSRQENEMVDSAPQWEQVLRRQKERSLTDPNNRRSKHRSRSRSPDVQAKEELWKHIQRELVDPIGLTEEELKEIPYTKVETQGNPIRIRHSHSPRSFRQYRRSQCSDGERSVLSEVNSRTDLVPPLPVTRASDAHGPRGSSAPLNQKRNKLEGSTTERKLQTASDNWDSKYNVKTSRTIQTPRIKNDS